MIILYNLTKKETKWVIGLENLVNAHLGEKRLQKSENHGTHLVEKQLKTQIHTLKQLIKTGDIGKEIQAGKTQINIVMIKGEKMKIRNYHKLSIIKKEARGYTTSISSKKTYSRKVKYKQQWI